MVGVLCNRIYKLYRQYVASFVVPYWGTSMGCVSAKTMVPALPNTDSGHKPLLTISVDVNRPSL